MNYPDDKDSTDKLFPHEFLFLLCNTKDWLDSINMVPWAHLTLDKKSIKKQEMEPLDAKRFDTIYKIDALNYTKHGNG